MSAESVQAARVERVENRRPSDVFLALWRDRAIDAEISVGEFGALADVWQQIRELEAIAVRDHIRDNLRDERAAEILRAYLAPDDGNPSSAPDGSPSPEEEGETVSESDTADEELDPRPIDELAAPDGKRYTGYGATFKNATRTRLLALRAQGLTTGKIMAAAGGALGFGELMDIIEGNKVRIDVYEALAGILDEIEVAAGSGDPALRGEVQG